MALPKLNFHQEFMIEGGSFYSSLSSVDESEFNEWVVNSFTKIGTIESFEQVKPTKAVFDRIIKGYNHIHGQCHYSAKAVCLLDNRFEYFTGFLERHCSHYSIITHSFNIYDGAIVDFSRFDKGYNPISESKSTLPHTYFGIQIPFEFVEKYKFDLLDEEAPRDMDPLLHKWFLNIKSPH
jgi:hypothetical protein